MNALLNRNKFLISGILITLIAALFTFILCNNDTISVMKADEVSTAREQPAMTISTPEEASKIAGFRVVAPAIDFADNLLEYKIEVITLRIATGGPGSHPVTQQWTLTDGSWVRLVQLPGLDMPETGDSLDFNGIEGRRVFLEGDSEMPPRIGFYWTDGDIGYCLSGTITDSIDETTLIAMVNSICPKIE